jgi:acrylyl-CoA reductase (NADPH)
MAVGTAGYTAMLCVLALENHGLTPDSGKILVTGAAGGVGSVAISILSKLGYHVVAVTGRSSEHDYLSELGAAEIIERQPFSDKARPLGKELWAGAIDVAGGNTLANVLSQVSYGGAVAACGLADSMDLPTSVAPFILRGISLYGIDSVMASIEKRKLAWQRITADLDLEKLDRISNEISLEGIADAAEAIMNGQIRGRTVIKIV